MVHVASSWMLCRVVTEDRYVDVIDCVGHCYPYFTIFIVLGLRGILVFVFFLDL
jgi:hypothetical protein